MRDAAPMLEVDALTLRFGGVTALEELSLEIRRGEICGLIGPNGAGKTSLFNCISRLYTPQEGRISFEGEDVLALAPHEVARAGIARTFQNVGLFPSLSVRGNVMLGRPPAGSGFWASALGLPGERRRERELEADAERLMEELEVDDVADLPASGLPYGTLKRIELARALMSRPRLIMLDEPAGGLTQAEVAELSVLIGRLRDDRDLTILVVEHHMGMVMGVSDRVIVLDFGRRIAVGTPAEVQGDRAVIDAYLGVAE